MSQYVIKNGGLLSQRLNSALIEELVHRELKNGVDCLETRIPMIRTAISPMVDAAYEMQKQCGDINIKSTPSAGIGIWKTSVAVNAYTDQLHHETDCTYTIIHVPNQESQWYRDKYHFQFHINRKCNIAIKLEPALTIMFAASMLTHRQTYNCIEDDDNECFISFGAYGNRQLFNHIKQSFIRKLN